MYNVARRFTACAFTAAFLSLSHPAISQSTSEASRMLADVHQLEAKTSPAVTKGLIGALQRQIAREGNETSAADDATTKALFQVYIAHLQEIGWANQVDTLFKLHPELIRNFELTGAQAERTTAILHALGARSVTSRMIESHLQISSADREAMLNEIRSAGIAKFMASHTGDTAVSAQGIAYNLYFNRPRLLPIYVNSVACNVVALETLAGALTGNEIVAAIGGYWLWVNC